jgi:hypothetical protein
MMETPWLDLQLSQALSGFARLQYLEMDAFAEVPWLSGLPQQLPEAGLPTARVGPCLVW